MATCDLRCNPDLAHIATHARNAEYSPRRFSGLIMRILEPKSTALLFTTGKVCLTGVRNEDDARVALRTVAKIVNKLGFACAFADFRIQNIVATGDCGFPIRLEGIAEEHSKFSGVRCCYLVAVVTLFVVSLNRHSRILPTTRPYAAQYEPELFPGLIYRMENPRIVFLVFVSGKIVVTGAKARSVMLEGLQKLYPVLYRYRKVPSTVSGALGGGAVAGVPGVDGDLA